VGEYIPTTSTINSAPRFDHNPTTGESLGLLVEEARTNLLLQSNGFDTTWTNTNSSETAAAGIAPDGTTTAWELKDTLDVISTVHNLTQILSWTSGVTYTISCWMKAGTLNEGGISFPGAAFTTVLTCRFDLTTGALINASAGVTASSVVFPNGWIRIVATATATITAAAGGIGIRITNGAGSYIGTGDGTILIWGAQLEVGAFPTSYIPTTAATVTRSADVCSISGSNFSAWYRQDEGTMFADAARSAVDSRFPATFTFSDNTRNNETYVVFGQGSAADGQMSVTTAGVLQAYLSRTGVASPARNIVAGTYLTNNINLVTNGSAATSDTSATIPTVDRAYIGLRGDGNGCMNGTIRRLTYWPTRLADSTLQAVTQ